MISARYYGGPRHGEVEARHEESVPERLYCDTYEPSPPTNPASPTDVVDVTKHVYKLQDQHEVGTGVIADYAYEGKVP